MGPKGLCQRHVETTGWINDIAAFGFVNEIVPLEWSELFQFSSVQSLSRVRLFATSWTAARQASLSITNSWNLVKLMSIETVMPSNHLVLCHPLLLLPSIFPSIGVFSSESVLCIRRPKYWSFSFSISIIRAYKKSFFTFWAIHLGNNDSVS